MQHIPMTSWPSAHWEDLRKQARGLENDIDSKLVSFSKLSTQHGTLQGRSRPDSYSKSPSEEAAPLLSSSDDGRVFDVLASEIESKLGQLSSINNQMADCMERFASSPGAALLHTLQRHRDILQDYLQEYNKTKANVEQFRAREELFGPLRTATNDRRSNPYLKENEHIRNSEKMVEDQIGIAVRTKENLASQRNTIRNVMGRLGSMSNRFPAVNNLMQRINFRKRRDAIILGTVMGICLFILMLLIFR